MASVSSFSTELSLSLLFFLLPPLVPGVAALPPGQLKDREHQPNPFSGDRGLKEPRRGPHFPAPELCVGGPPPLKPRRHGDTDKPKGKRPCKTKHTSQREREREKRKEAAPYSPGQRAAADPGSAEEDKVSADGRRLQVQGLFSMLSAPLITQLGEAGRRKEVCLQCSESCWSADLPVPSEGSLRSPRRRRLLPPPLSFGLWP